MTDTIALALVALEVDEPLDALAQRLGADVMFGPAGVRHIDGGLAAQLIDKHRLRQAEARRRSDERRGRLAAVSQRVHNGLRGPVPAMSDDPVADMISLDGDLPRVKAAEARLEGWLRGRSTGARISPKGT